MRYLKDQSGAALVFEIVLIAVVLAVAGYAVYTSMHHESNAVATKNTPTPSVSPSPTPNPYAGWESYTSPYEQASFKYPSNWTLTQKEGLDPTTNDYEIILKSPAGLELNYWDLVSGLGGGCGTSPLTFAFSSVQPLTNIDTQGKETIYLVQSSAGIALTDKSAWSNGQAGGLEVGSCGAYLTIANKLNHPGSIAFGTAYFFGDQTPALPSSQLQDLPTAKLILESFRF